MDTENAPGTAAGPFSLQSQFYTLQVANSAVCIARAALMRVSAENVGWDGGGGLM